MAEPTVPTAAPAAPAAPTATQAGAASRPRTWKEKLHSASWWIGVATAVAGLVDALTGMHVPTGALASVAGVVASLIIGTGLPS